MAPRNQIKITKGQNFRVLHMEGFGELVFGCPPGIVKELGRLGQDLPCHYVIPIRTFVKGRNNFDFEFIIYSFLFVSTVTPRPRINIYCTREQRDRFKTIISETLFGPKFHHLLRAQFHKFCSRNDFSFKEKKVFEAFLKKVSSDKKLYRLFKDLLQSHAGDAVILKTLRGYFSRFRKPKWLVDKSIARLEHDLAKNYLICAQLKSEMDLFGLVAENKRNRFIEDVIDFHLFDKDHTVFVNGEQDRRKKLKIVQQRPSAFDVILKKEKICTVDISHLDPPVQTLDIQPIQKPFMGVTFMGVGSGFAPKRKESCLIVWSEGKGLMVDAFNDITNNAIRYGITENDILYMFLTHVHSDHDGGLAEVIMSGQRIKVISSRIIFESFLRKLEAITCFPRDVLEGFVDFMEVEPHKKIRLPGLKNTYLKFDYSLHSIPAGRFTLTYQDPSGKETVISHSGDTKYDPERARVWYEQGIFSPQRYNDVTGFIWDSDLIIHDVGGGSLHTELKCLETVDDATARRTVLVHQHEDPEPHPRFRYAREGETITLIQKKTMEEAADVDAIRDVGLFKGLNESDLLEIFNHSEIVKYQPDECVFAQNDVGNDAYVILDGFAEIIIDDETFAVYEKGQFFGELVLTTDNPHRRATIKAKSPLTLLKVSKKFYRQFNLPQIQEELYKINNFFNDIMHPSLLASLALGKIKHWDKNEKIVTIGSGDKGMYIILSGQVEVQDSRKHKCMVRLGSGDVVGEVEGQKRFQKTANAMAYTDDVYAIRLSKNDIKQVFKLFPSFHGTVYQKVKKLEAILA